MPQWIKKFDKPQPCGFRNLIESFMNSTPMSSSYDYPSEPAESEPEVETIPTWIPTPYMTINYYSNMAIRVPEFMQISASKTAKLWYKYPDTKMVLVVLETKTAMPSISLPYIGNVTQIVSNPMDNLWDPRVAVSMDQISYNFWAPFIPNEVTWLIRPFFAFAPEGPYSDYSSVVKDKGISALFLSHFAVILRFMVRVLQGSYSALLNSFGVWCDRNYYTELEKLWLPYWSDVYLRCRDYVWMHVNSSLNLIKNLGVVIHE